MLGSGQRDSSEGSNHNLITCITEPASGAGASCLRPLQQCSQQRRIAADRSVGRGGGRVLTRKMCAGLRCLLLRGATLLVLVLVLVLRVVEESADLQELQVELRCPRRLSLLPVECVQVRRVFTMQE